MHKDQDYVVKDDEILIVDEVYRTYHAGPSLFRWSSSGDRGERAC